MGPTNRTTSLSPDVENPAFRAITFDQIAAAYKEQARGLLDGGVDLLLPETTFDTLNLKAALFAIQTLFEERGSSVPVIASLTITDQSGRTLSGQTLEAAWVSISHAPLIATGLNCALGRRADGALPRRSSAHRAASDLLLPERRPSERVRRLRRDPRADGARPWASSRSRAGSTSPAAAAARRRRSSRRSRRRFAACRPHAPVERVPYTQLSGLEPLTIRPDSNFIVIGERTNVTGSKRFARLIAANDYEAALDVARDQVAGGANIIDVNMDEGLLDSEAAMTTFLHLIGVGAGDLEAPDHGGQLEVDRARGGPEVPSGQGRRELDLAEGRRRVVPPTRRARSAGTARPSW